MNYREALAWLYSTQRFGIKLGLENAARLFAALRLPARHRVIHVAGTNGKGSVCAMAEAVGRAAGLCTGLFTSPHLITFRERIQVRGERITERQVCEGLSRIRDLVHAWEPHPTFFEITTALGLLHFAEMECDLVVLETGLGGRLDATNAIKSNVAVLTPIGLDHQEILGHSLGEIAREKAGIIKPGVPVISSPQGPACEKVIRSRAAECGASLCFIASPYDSEINLAGEYQRWNAALAVAAIAGAGIELPAKAIRTGLMSVYWPARFQRWSERLVIDGAHNEPSALALAATWKETFGRERAHLILGMLRDKDAAAIWRALAPIASQVTLAHFASERALPPAALRATISAISPEIPIHELADISEGLFPAPPTSTPVLITGSLHFAGEALAVLRGERASLEECLQ